MPKRTDISKILLIGSGPIIIGQACEFDYSGTQACKALREEGYKVILVNSNPATIMTDPEMADATYIEPLTADILEMIIEKERPDAILPTMGGQTALNLAVELAESGVLEKYTVELIGAKLHAIKKAEDRELFKEAMKRIGLDVPKSTIVKAILPKRPKKLDEESLDFFEQQKTEAINRAIFESEKRILEEIGLPCVFRPSYTLGGTGGGVAFNSTELEILLSRGLENSIISQVLVEESVLGWKEYELEVMRDGKDNVVIICSIENFDPMGIHTGDSITVAPAQTLTDKEYQRMRDASIAIIREIGVDTGGSNIQFALNQNDGRMVVIEMNPRVSRSSALASKATGFPIAKIAAKLAIGLTLDEIPNDITRETPASFEPTIDYVVTKFPRFAFEKFPEADPTLTTQMKSVGEVMSIGRTFKESLQKAVRSLETGSYGFEEINAEVATIKAKLKTPNSERVWYIAQALREGLNVQDVYERTWIDPWFLQNIKQIVEMEEKIKVQSSKFKVQSLNSEKTNKGIVNPEFITILRRAKEWGFSDRRIAGLLNVEETEIRHLRRQHKIHAVYRMVDTCGAEFAAFTPYLYSTYEKPYYKLASERQTPPQSPLGKGGTGWGENPEFSNPPIPPLEKGGKGGFVECEANPSDRKKVVILGSGPNRIGQGIEFDYCCVHAVFSLKEAGYETIMVNCNPETVSTDYDTADRLYFEPLTIEDVLNIIDTERPEGVIVQFGGQTPLKLAVPLEKEGVKIMGTSPDSIDRAEDRKRFKELLHKLNLKQAESDTALSVEEAEHAADRIGYPVMVRPSYVLGGRAMEIVYDKKSLQEYMKRAVKASHEHPVLVDKYLEDAIEVDVDAIADGKEVIIGGVMEHIEEAGIHSGDSACSLPPHSLRKDVVDQIKMQTKALADELNVVGLMNVQFAVKNGDIYILEVNPRASRTIPFVSKATGVPLAKIAAKLMVGKKLKEIGLTGEKQIRHIAVKEAVFPFDRFHGVDTILGPEMKSTGEVMGIDEDFGIAFGKSQISCGNRIPLTGKIFISLKDKDKPTSVPIVKKLLELGLSVIATRGTAIYLKDHGLDVETVNKVAEGRPHIVDLIKNKEINFVINTVSGAQAQRDSFSIRQSALQYRVPFTTTISGAIAAVNAINMLKKKQVNIKSIQEYHRGE